jgi:predicted DCC family thiol-disulfide oxidoreductase YuxK
MQRLYVLYDSQCEFCRRCRNWLGQQPAYVPLAFLPLQSPEAECRFPGIKELHPEKEVVVISDAGEVWQGAAAWVTCLWALREYRVWAQRLAHPALQPLARRLCEIVSASRYRISQWLTADTTNEQLQQKLEIYPEPVCESRNPTRQPPPLPINSCRAH